MTYTEQVYEVFLSEIDDEFFGFLKPHIMRRQLHLYLLGAIVDFKECTKKLEIENYINEEIISEKGQKRVIVDNIDNVELEVIGIDTGKMYSEIKDYKIIPLEYQNHRNTIVFNDELKEDIKIYKYNNGNFVEDLSYEEIYILALGMVCQWIKPKRNKEENLKNVITDGSYKKLSSANMLDKVIKLSDKIEEEYDRKRIDYTYNDFKGFD